ncbi:MAG: hypothetical protein N2C14_18315, partial [Planctomycetales bacterium]
AFCDDGKWIAMGGDGVRIFDFETGKEAATLVTAGNARGMDFSPDGKLIAVACGENVELWNRVSGERQHVLKHIQPEPPEDPGLWLGFLQTIGWAEEEEDEDDANPRVETTAFSPNGTQVVSGGDDGKVKIWDVENGELAETIESDVDKVYVVQMRPDGKRLAIAGLGGEVHDLTKKSSGTPTATFGMLRYRSLTHGRILHGYQYVDKPVRSLSTSYYSSNTGMGLAVNLHPVRRGDATRDVAPRGLMLGVIGLGTGTSAALARKGDRVRFYEINPLVKQLSEEKDAPFTYWKDCLAEDKEIVLGDARISLERRAAVPSGQREEKFDVIAVDAFSSDA